MLSVQKNRLFQVIRQSIENESPDLLIDFDRGVVKRLFSLFSFLIKDLFMHPISLLKKIVKLFGIKK